MFITFEGTEGVGKSTLIRGVAERLRARRRIVMLTREPGGCALSEKIRDLILAQGMDPWTEIFLYEAARAEHVTKAILPALERGEDVLCDRFTDSTLAYQAQARGLPWKAAIELNRLATQGLSPDVTVWLDVDPAVGLARARERTRFEDEGLAFQKNVRQGFAKASRVLPRRWLKLTVGQATPEDLADQVIAALFKRKLLKD